MEVVACTEEDLPPGGRYVASVRGREILLVRSLDGRAWGIANRCPHQGAQLSGGHVSGTVGFDAVSGVRMERIGEVIRCPWHNFAFDVTTGCSLLEPERYRVASYSVSISDGKVHVHV